MPNSQQSLRQLSVLLLVVGVAAGVLYLQSRAREKSRPSGPSPNSPMRFAVRELRQAVQSDRLYQVRQFFASGVAREARLDERNHTALLLAAEDGYVDIVGYMLSRNAELEARDTLGGTSLLLAAANLDAKSQARYLAQYPQFAGVLDSASASSAAPQAAKQAEQHTEVMRLLLEAGASPNPAQSPHGWSPLQFAVAGDHKPAVRLLLSHRADINARDAEGRTALFDAALTGRTDLCKLLLEHGAHPQIRDSKGKTALAYAPSQNRAEIARLFARAAQKQDVLR